MLLLLALLSGCSRDDVVPTPWSLPDSALADCVAAAVGVPAGELVEADLAGLTHLACVDAGITELTGLEAAEDLVGLSLWENEVVVLTALSGLTALEDLQLGHNRIVDVGPLSGLTKLTTLGLSLNDVDDVDALADLRDLAWLDLAHNQLDDDAVASLCDLPALRWLTVEHNELADPGTLDCFAFDDVFGRYQGAEALLAGPPGAVPAPPPRSPGPLPALRGSGHRQPVALDADSVPDAWVPGVRNTTLLDLALASPNQFDAGSCLFMSGTGAVEILLNQHVPAEERVYGGQTDLSERFLMVAGDHAALPDGLPADFLWTTDVVYLYGAVGGSLLDGDYPFLVDYVVQTADGYALAEPDDPDATFSALASWIDQLPGDWSERLVDVPPVTRTVLALDPELDASSVWAVGVLDRDVVGRIKHELDSKRAPVVVTYNHFLYWHGNVVVGYDDEIETDGCRIVEDSIEYFEETGNDAYADAIRAHMEDQGGCREQGVFYVRDSIYDGTDEPAYTYNEDLSYEDTRAARLVALPYDWVVYLGNHVQSVHRAR